MSIYVLYIVFAELGQYWEPTENKKQRVIEPGLDFAGGGGEGIGGGGGDTGAVGGGG
jgi:hypothetical protein